MTDRKGLATTYAYDEQDRVISLTRPDGVTRLSYDAVGRLTEISDPSGTISYAYDAAGRVVRETQATGGATSVIEYGYDALDRRTSRSVAGVFNEVTTYGYDAAGRRVLQTMSGSVLADTVFTATYDEADRMSAITLTTTAQTFVLAYDDN